MGAVSFKRVTAEGDGGTNRKEEGEPTAVWGRTTRTFELARLMSLGRGLTGSGNKKALKTSVFKASHLLGALTHFRNYHPFLQSFLQMSTLF